MAGLGKKKGKNFFSAFPTKRGGKEKGKKRGGTLTNFFPPVPKRFFSGVNRK